MTRLLSYYADDFTGSTDVMEALASHGVKTVMFTRIPTEEEFRPFTDYQGFGLAGTSRSQLPGWMDIHLPGAFNWLQNLHARYCHYKVCSTFDSSPTIGSIGRAIDIGVSAFQQSSVLLIVGVPQLKRYTFAGHLFADYLGQSYRIDRHPVMSKHPVTPMNEADLCLHLAKQTALPVELAASAWPEHGIGMLDVYDTVTQEAAGQRLLNFPQPFVVGSSGVEYALMQAMQLPKQSFAELPPVNKLIAVSGSVSPTTERQITYSLSHGFKGIAIDPLKLISDHKATEVQKAVTAALQTLQEGKSPLVFTACGPSTDVRQKLSAFPDARRHIGEALGKILKQVLLHSTVRRAIVAGGDSSGHALGQLDVHALTVRFPLVSTPGSPVCTVHSQNADIHGLEIALKGGQVGGDDYFVSLRDGLR
jgi:3-oxoisoapionate kinase